MTDAVDSPLRGTDCGDDVAFAEQTALGRAIRRQCDNRGAVRFEEVAGLCNGDIAHDDAADEEVAGDGLGDYLVGILGDSGRHDELEVHPSHRGRQGIDHACSTVKATQRA